MKTPVTKLSGIGPSLSVVLAEHGFDTVEDIASSNLESLSAVPGFGRIKAEVMLSAAKTLTKPEKKDSKKNKKKKDKAKTKSKSDKKKKKKKGGKKKGKKDKKRKPKKGSKKKKKK